MSQLSPVLLAEDNPNDVLLVQRAFQENRAPNPIHVVGNGEEAIQYLAGEGPFADRGDSPGLPSHRPVRRRGGMR